MAGEVKNSLSGWHELIKEQGDRHRDDEARKQRLVRARFEESNYRRLSPHEWAIIAQNMRPTEQEVEAAEKTGSTWLAELFRRAMEVEHVDSVKE